MHVEAVEPSDHALVVDDLIATGSSLCAAMNLLVNHFVKVWMLAVYSNILIHLIPTSSWSKKICDITWFILNFTLKYQRCVI